MDQLPLSQTAVDFSMHINQESQWKDASRIPKTDLREYYTNQYKPLFKANHCGLNITNFSTLFTNMLRRKLVQYQKENGVTYVMMKTTKLTAQSGQGDMTAQQYPKREPRRKRKKARAVDQYITMSKGDPIEIISDLSRNGDEDTGLPTGIVQTGVNKYECTLCNVKMTSPKVLEEHRNGKNHFARSLLTAFKDKNLKYICNSYVEVKSDYDHEGRSIRLDDLLPNKKITISITLKNTMPNQEVTLLRYELIKRNRVFSFDDDNKVCDRKGVVKIQPGDTYEVRMTVNPKNINQYHGCVAFVLENEDKKLIQIIRYLSAICTTPQVKEFGPTAPFRKPPRVILSRPRGEIEDGYRPDNWDNRSQLEQVEPLKPYPIHNWMRKLVNMGLKPVGPLSKEEQLQLENIKAVLQVDLTLKSHKDLFDLLLLLEEIQMEVDIRKYDMESVPMEVSQVNRRLLCLKVPGLAENRPSVLRGDHLFVKLKDEGNVEYKGYVHTVQLEEVHLGFGEKLMKKFINGMKFDVRFTFNRRTMQMMHRAVELAEEHSLDNILFPTPAIVGSRDVIQPIDTKLRLYDKKLEENKEQETAVHHIVSGISRPAPYLLFGPPGTGKTVTMVESIKQVRDCIPTAHILVCAPSNSAADLVCQRLVNHVPKKEVFRMNAQSRSVTDIPEDIMECCNLSERQFYYPQKAVLQEYKIIITTLMTAGRIASANFPSGHFTHVFIDECGHSAEPETLIALAGILESDIYSPDGGQVVLAGDPKQLGPVLRSPVAIKHGLGQSLLERLMGTCDVYSRDDTNIPPYNSKCITKLVRNYRSHPEILVQPNKMFYDDELQVCANQFERESLCNWSELPKKGFPILFHGVVGEDLREERSPSFFNPQECCVVVNYVEQLLNGRGIMKLKPKQIGIISPYRRQVQKLRTDLHRKKLLTDLKIGSVEEFQGQERMVIIISTVRSSKQFLPIDSDFKIGFLKNPKRFNVAVTRAKALLIIVGNPYLLRTDPNWNQLLQFVIQKGGYTGPDMVREDDEMDDIIDRMTDLKLDKDTTDEDGISAVTDQEEPEWRRDN